MSARHLYHATEVGRSAHSADWLRAAANRADVSHSLARITTAWPALSRICESLAFFLTPVFPGVKRPLLEECLVDLVGAFETLQQAAQVDVGGDPKAFGALLRALVAKTPEIMKTRALGPRQKGYLLPVWIPGAEPLGAFWHRYEGKIEFSAEPHDYQVSDAIVRQYVSLSLMHLHEVEFLQRASAEEELVP